MNLYFNILIYIYINCIFNKIYKLDFIYNGYYSENIIRPKVILVLLIKMKICYIY